jgi:O-antigen ligase
MFLWLLIPLILLLFCYSIDFGYMGNMADRTFDAPTLDKMSTSRILIWKEMLQELHHSPWLGLGPQSIFFLNELGPNIIHAHNWVLQFLLEWGVVGTMLFVLILYVLIHQGWQKFKSDNSDYLYIRLTAGLAFVALSITGLFGGTYFFIPTVVLIVIFLSIWTKAGSSLGGLAGRGSSGQTHHWK